MIDSINLTDIQDIKRDDNPLTNTFEIYGANGKIIKIDIARLNGAQTFANALQAERTRAQSKSADDKPVP